MVQEAAAENGPMVVMTGPILAMVLGTAALGAGSVKRSHRLNTSLVICISAARFARGIR
jgi:hypothetical protein